MVTQHYVDLSSFVDENLVHMTDSNVLDQTDLIFSFDEMERIAQTENFTEYVYDNSKVADNNGVTVGLPVAPCAVMVQPASPNPYTTDDTHMLQPAVSPEMVLLQPVSPAPMKSEVVLSPYSVTSDSSEYLSLPPTTPQPATPSQHYLVTHYLQPSSNEPVLLHAADSLLTVEQPVLSPYSVQDEDQSFAAQNTAVAPKKRGRKRKYPEGTTSSRSRSKKTKVYEMAPLPDEKEEKKRKNAINAKRHRDMQKNERVLLAEQLKVVTAERDNLQTDNLNLLKLVKALQQNEALLQLQLVNKDQNVLL